MAELDGWGEMVKNNLHASQNAICFLKFCVRDLLFLNGGNVGELFDDQILIIFKYKSIQSRNQKSWKIENIMTTFMKFKE